MREEKLICNLYSSLSSSVQIYSKKSSPKKIIFYNQIRKKNLKGLKKLMHQKAENKNSLHEAQKVNRGDCDKK
jgi:hypothetical protein